MAFNPRNFGAVFRDAKSRTIILVVMLIILIGIGIAWLGFKRAQQPGAPAAASIQKVPGIKSIPLVGGVPSREYTKLQEEANLQAAQQAAQTGQSALPVLTRGTYVGPEEFAQPTTPAAGVGGSSECSPEALARARQAGVKAEELRCKGCSVAQLRAAGYTAGELLNAGFSAKELKDAGFSADDLRAAGFTAAELARAGFAPGELAAAGFSAAELNKAGIGADQLTAAGITPQQLAAAGIGAKASNLPKDCSVDALRQARSRGVPAAQLRAMGCSAAALRAAGFTAKELKDAGFSAQELKDAGFSADELRKAGFTAGELRQAGFGAKDLKDAGFGADQLRAAGFSADDLAAAGSTPNELTAAGFSNGELTRAGLATATPVTPVTTFIPQAPVSTQGQLGPAPPTAATIPSISQDGEVAALESLQRRQAEQLSLQARQDRITQLQQTMTQQATDLFASWAPPPLQQYQEGKEQPGTIMGNGGLAGGTLVPSSNQLLAAANQSPVIKAGDVMFAVLDTAVNTDEPSPVLATIVDSPCVDDKGNLVMNSGCANYKNAKLVGQIQRVDKKVILSFTQMNIPWLNQSITINAVAIDPNTARTALASEVNSHYFQRFALLFASEFITGLGQAVEQSGSTTTISVAGVTNTNPTRSAGQEATIALGRVGQRAAEVLAPLFTRPPTVRVNAGEGIGILYMNDVTINPAPTAAAVVAGPTPVTPGGTPIAAAAVTPATVVVPTTTTPPVLPPQVPVVATTSTTP